MTVEQLKKPLDAYPDNYEIEVEDYYYQGSREINDESS